MSEAKSPLPEWQQYPTFGELLTEHEKFLDLRRRSVRSCEQLDRLLRDGKPEQQSAAQGSINAYGLALRLLDEAIAARDQVTKA